MPMQAKLADGRILNFPDGTDPSVVQATVKKVLGIPASSAPEVAPASDVAKPQAEGGLLRQFAHGAAFGFDDELAGLVSAATGGEYESAKKAYDEGRQAYSEENPYSSFAANLVGNVATTAPAAAGVGATAVGSALKKLPLWMQGASSGLAAGALQGSGEAEVGERMAGAGEGAVIGGITGGALPLTVQGASPVVRGAYRGFVEPYVDAAAIKGRAYLDAAGDRAKAVAQALRNSMSDVQGVNRTAGEAAVPAQSAEFSSFAQRAKRIKGSEYAERDKSNAKAMADAIRSFGKDKAALKAAEDLRAKNAEVNYGSIKDKPVGRQGQLKALRKRPSIKAALGAAKTTAQERQGGYFPSKAKEPLTVENVQDMYEYLGRAQQSAGKAADAGTAPPVKPSLIGDTKGELATWIDSQGVPEWTAARDQYRQESIPIDQMRVGQYLEQKLTPALEDSSNLRAETFAQARRDAPRTIKGSLKGGPSYEELSDVLTPDQVKIVDSVERELANTKELDRLAKYGAGSGKDPLKAFTHSLDSSGHPELPNYAFDPKITLAKLLLRRMRGQIDAKLAEQIAQEMLNPQAVASSMESAIARRAKAERLANILRKHAALGSGVAGSTVAAAQE